MSENKVKIRKLPLLVYAVAIIIFITAVYLIFIGGSIWHKYYFNPPMMNSSQLDMNADLESRGLPNLNHLIAWIGLFPALVLGLFFIFADISLLRRKNWARRTIIVISLIIGSFLLLGIFANWTRILYAIIWIAMGIYLLTSRDVKMFFRKYEGQKYTKKTRQDLKGLGGWLIPVQIVLISSLLSYLIFMVLIFIGQIYKDYAETLILVIFLLYAVAFILNSLVTFLMYKKTKSFLFYAQLFLYYDIVITFFLFNIFSSVVNLIMMGSIVYYLMRSRRIKNTFIN